MKKLAAFVALFLVGLTFYSYNRPQELIEKSIKIDKIIVEKSKRQLHVYSRGNLIKTYKISLGKTPKDDKKVEGDKKTPEGSYIINDKNPNSECHKNLGISYPNAEDSKEAAILGKKPGGNIKIHGLLNGKGWIGRFHTIMDWTAGCIAVTDEEMDELYDIVAVGTPIIINP